MNNVSSIRFLRRYGKDGMAIETSYDVAIVSLNTMNHMVGQPVVVAYYTDYNQTTRTGTKINAITAIGINNGTGRDCYEIVSNGEIEPVYLVTDETVPDVSKLTNGLIAVCYNNENIPCYCTYDSENSQRVFTPIEEDRTFYSGADGFIWFVSKGKIKRSDDFMSEDEVKSYIDQYLSTLDPSTLSGNGIYEWNDTDSDYGTRTDGYYSRILDIPTNESIVLAVEIIAPFGHSYTDILTFTSSTYDVKNYCMSTDYFYEYRTSSYVSGGICVKSRGTGLYGPSFKFKILSCTCDLDKITWYISTTKGGKGYKEVSAIKSKNMIPFVKLATDDIEDSYTVYISTTGTGSFDNETYNNIILNNKYSKTATNTVTLTGDSNMNNIYRFSPNSTISELTLVSSTEKTLIDISEEIKVGKVVDVTCYNGSYSYEIKNSTGYFSSDDSLKITNNNGLVDFVQNPKEFNFIIVNNSTGGLEYYDDNGTPRWEWIKVLDVPINNFYSTGLNMMLLYVRNNQSGVGGFITFSPISAKPVYAIGDYNFRNSMEGVEFGFKIDGTKSSLWFRYDYAKGYSFGITFKVISAPSNDWSYSIKDFDYPSQNIYTRAKSDVVKINTEYGTEDAVTSGSTNLVTSGAVYTEINNINTTINDYIATLLSSNSAAIKSIKLSSTTVNPTSGVADLTGVAESVSNKSKLLNSSSTDDQYPTSKVVYDEISSLDSRIGTNTTNIGALQTEEAKDVQSVKIGNSVLTVKTGTHQVDLTDSIEDPSNKVDEIPDTYNEDTDSGKYTSVYAVKNYVDNHTYSPVNVTLETSYDTINGYKYQGALVLGTMASKIDVAYTKIDGDVWYADTLYFEKLSETSALLKCNTDDSVFSLAESGGKWYICVKAKLISTDSTWKYVFTETNCGASLKALDTVTFFNDTQVSEYVGEKTEENTYNDNTTITLGTGVSDFDFDTYNTIIYNGDSTSEVSILNTETGSLPSEDKVFHFINSTGKIIGSLNFGGYSDSSLYTTNVTDIQNGAEVTITYLNDTHTFTTDVTLQKYHSSNNSVSISQDKDGWNFTTTGNDEIENIYITRANRSNYLYNYSYRNSGGSSTSYGQVYYQKGFCLNVPTYKKNCNFYFENGALDDDEYIVEIWPKSYVSSDQSSTEYNGTRISLSGNYNIGFLFNDINKTFSVYGYIGGSSIPVLMQYYYSDINYSTKISNSSSVKTEYIPYCYTKDTYSGSLKYTYYAAQCVGYHHRVDNDRDSYSITYTSTEGENGAVTNIISSDKNYDVPEFIDFIFWRGRWYCNGLEDSTPDSVEFTVESSNSIQTVDSTNSSSETSISEITEDDPIVLKSYTDPYYLRLSSTELTAAYNSTTRFLDLSSLTRIPDVIIWDDNFTSVVEGFLFNSSLLKYGHRLTIVFTHDCQSVAAVFSGKSSVIGGQSTTGAIYGLTYDTSAVYNVYGTQILDFVYWNHGWYTRHY